MRDHTGETDSSGNLRLAFAKRFGCDGPACERKLLWKCIEPAALPLALAVGLLKRDFFRPDIEYLRQASDATCRREIIAEANAIRHDSTLRRGVLRRLLRVRISGRRLLRLGRELLE